MAIACFLLFTLPPLPPRPERKVPFFLRRMALATVFPAPLLYLRRPFFWLASWLSSTTLLRLMPPLGGLYWRFSPGSHY